MEKQQAPRPPGRYRHEYKYPISYPDYLVLTQKLRTLMWRDSHADENGSYRITGLYFDNCFDKALKEKLHGVNRREKFRLRYYGENSDTVFLEKKQKINELCLKNSALLTRGDCMRILRGELEVLECLSEPLLAEFVFKQRTQLLRPSSVVRYVREPYVYEPGNVRVTFDSQLSTGLCVDSFFDPAPTPITDGSMIMELKYDEFLPQIIRELVQPYCPQLQAFSKYAACRTMA